MRAVLLQEGRPVAFYSQTLSERAQAKSVYERELMAIVIGVQKWRHYLMGRHFIILTDQKSLKFLSDQRVLGEEQFKWTWIIHSSQRLWMFEFVESFRIQFRGTRYMMHVNQRSE